MIEIKNSTYLTEEDKILVEKSINYNVWLICGNDIEKQQSLKNFLINSKYINYYDILIISKLLRWKIRKMFG